MVRVVEHRVAPIVHAALVVDAPGALLECGQRCLSEPLFQVFVGIVRALQRDHRLHRIGHQLSLVDRPKGVDQALKPLRCKHGHQPHQARNGEQVDVIGRQQQVGLVHHQHHFSLPRQHFAPLVAECTTRFDSVHDPLFEQAHHHFTRFTELGRGQEEAYHGSIERVGHIHLARLNRMPRHVRLAVTQLFASQELLQQPS